MRPALWLVGLALLSPCAWGGALSIMPTQVQFSDGQAVQSVLLTNVSGETVTVEAQVVVWPDDAPQQLANDLVITPAVVTLPPSQRMRLRIGILRKGAGDAERAYRIYFTELPRPVAANAQGIGVRLRVGIPVFIPPAVPKPAPLRWKAVDVDGGWSLQAVNAGNLHARIGQIVLVAPEGNRPMQGPSSYVLATGSLAMPMPHPPAAGTRVRWLEDSDEHESLVELP